MGMQKGANGDEAFSRAAYDELRDSEITYGVRWSLTVSAGFQKGVWSFRTEVCNLMDKPGMKPVVSLEETWPNARNGSFAAFLYQHNHKVGRMVEAWWLDRQRSEAPRVA